jgi:spermidine synthase
MDGRNLIESLCRRQRNGENVPTYDVIYGDAYNDWNVPFHLTTLEYNQKIAELLAPNGMYMINMIDMFDPGLFLGAVVNTFKESFGYAYVVVPKLRGAGFGSELRNTFVVVGSLRPLDLSELGKRA